MEMLISSMKRSVYFRNHEKDIDAFYSNDISSNVSMN